MFMQGRYGSDQLNLTLLVLALIINIVFSFTTGKGPFFNDYEIPDYWDEEYKEIGITREEITAEFLA